MGLIWLKEKTNGKNKQKHLGNYSQHLGKHLGLNNAIVPLLKTF